jgi:hypothetical protein
MLGWDLEIHACTIVHKERTSTRTENARDRIFGDPRHALISFALVLMNNIKRKIFDKAKDKTSQSPNMIIASIIATTV